MNNLPFSSIGPYSDSFTSTTVLSRMIEGIGFRFYWATEGLRQIDLDYKPCDDGRSCYENIEHISMLSDAISDAFEGRIYDFSNQKSGFEDYRKNTLNNLDAIFKALKENSDLSKVSVRLNMNSEVVVTPFWNLINGPFSDIIYHTGQVVAFRRITGNPINPGVNVFVGQVMA